MSDFTRLLAKMDPKDQVRVSAFLEHGTSSKAARALGVSSATVRRSIRRAKECGVMAAWHDRVEEEALVTYEGLISECDENRRVAIGQQQMSAAVQATVAKARIGGFLNKPDRPNQEAFVGLTIIGPSDLAARPMRTINGAVIEHQPDEVAAPMEVEGNDGE